MKKLLIILATCSPILASAMTTIDFNSQFYSESSNFLCNGVKLTPQTTITDISQNCRNVTIIEREENTNGFRSNSGNPLPGQDMHTSNPLTPKTANLLLSKVEFYTDKGHYVICYYNNSNLDKCKLNEQMSIQPQIVAPVAPNVVATKKTSSTPSTTNTKTSSSAAN